MITWTWRRTWICQFLAGLESLLNNVRRRDIVRPAQLAGVAGDGALFGFLLVVDGVTLAVRPALACGALDDQLPVFVAVLTGRAKGQGVAWAAKGVVVVPLRIESGVARATHLTNGTPERIT